MPNVTFESLPDISDTPTLARFLGVSPSFLEGYRSRGEGPRFIRIGTGRNGAIRYRKAAILAWLEECETEHSALTNIKSA